MDRLLRQRRRWLRHVGRGHDHHRSDYRRRACFCETQVQGGKGWLATIGAGYDYQFTSRIVAGVFGDASISSLKGTIQDRSGCPGFAGDIKQTSSWAAGARAGWLVNPQDAELRERRLHRLRASPAPTWSIRSPAPDQRSRPRHSQPTAGSLAAVWKRHLSPGLVLAQRVPLRLLRQQGRSRRSPGPVCRHHLQAHRPDRNHARSSTNLTAACRRRFIRRPLRWPPTGPASTPMAVSAMACGALTTTENVLGTGSAAVARRKCIGGKGYLGVVGAGYDWQFAPAWVAGVFGDVDVSSLKGTIQDQTLGYRGHASSKHRPGPPARASAGCRARRP